MIVHERADMFCTAHDTSCVATHVSESKHCVLTMSAALNDVEDIHHILMLHHVDANGGMQPRPAGLSDKTFQYDWIATVQPANIPPSTQGSTAEPDMDNQQAETHSQLKDKHVSAAESDQSSPKHQGGDVLQAAPAPGHVAMDAPHSTDPSSVPLRKQPEAAEARHTATESPSKADADPAASVD